MVQWLRFHPSSAGGMGSIHGFIMIPYATRDGQKININKDY